MMLTPELIVEIGSFLDYDGMIAITTLNKQIGKMMLVRMKQDIYSSRHHFSKHAKRTMGNVFQHPLLYGLYHAKIRKCQICKSRYTGCFQWPGIYAHEKCTKPYFLDISKTPLPCPVLKSMKVSDEFPSYRPRGRWNDYVWALDTGHVPPKWTLQGSYDHFKEIEKRKKNIF